MTAALREDAADEAQANLAEIEGIKADLALAVARLDRLAMKVPLDLCSSLQDAAAQVENEVIKGSLFLAEREIRQAIPDLDTRYSGRRAPGSFGV